MKTGFEKLRISQLENLHFKLNRQIVELQEQLAKDMGRISYHDILPRNYNIIPQITKCNLDDLQRLEELTAKKFKVFWTLEYKKAAKKGTLEKFYAEYKFYDLRNRMNDEQINELFIKAEEYCHQRMTTHKIIQCIIEAPNFLEEVMI